MNPSHPGKKKAVTLTPKSDGHYIYPKTPVHTGESFDVSSKKDLITESNTFFGKKLAKNVPEKFVSFLAPRSGGHYRLRI